MTPQRVRRVLALAVLLFALLADPMAHATPLDTLEVAPSAPMAGYSRLQFGPAWTSDNDDHWADPHCDVRDDVLARDLTDVVKKGCKVESGTLNDPYTGQSIHFQRGPKSTAVQIDHVVPLGDAWQTGAQALTARQRVDLAEDPIELLAVSGPPNEAKSDKDASQWLPPNTAFRCQYVDIQVAVKVKYQLWVTLTEKGAMAAVLAGCPG